MLSANTSPASELMANVRAAQILGLPPVVMWQGDDSPKSYKVLGFMLQHAKEGGGRVLLLESYGTKQLEAGQETAGTFIYINN